MRGLVRGGLAALLVAILAACAIGPTETPPACPTAAPTQQAARSILAGATHAQVVTSLGTFSMALDPSSAPVATASFVALARCGFYDGITFHRVIAGFVIQAGDPQTKANRAPFDGLGNGGPGYQFGVEFPAAGQTYDRYTVAMANAMQYDQVTGDIQGGADTNGSQFFIDLATLDGQLRPYYSVIGRVTDGTDVVDAIGGVATNGPQDPPTPAYVPVEPVVITSITVKSSS